MFILHFHIRGTSIYGSIKKGGMYENDASIHKENDTKSIASAASKNTAKKAESVKSKQNTSKPASTKPVKYSQTTIKNVQPIAGVGLVEIDIDDVVFYNENIDKYKKEKDEKLIPFIVRLNESFKKDALTRQRSKKYKHIAYWGFGLLFVGIIIFILYLCYGWISSLWK